MCSNENNIFKIIKKDLTSHSISQAHKSRLRAIHSYLKLYTYIEKCTKIIYPFKQKVENELSLKCTYKQTAARIMLTRNTSRLIQTS